MFNKLSFPNKASPSQQTALLDKSHAVNGRPERTVCERALHGQGVSSQLAQCLKSEEEHCFNKTFLKDNQTFDGSNEMTFS